MDCNSSTRITPWHSWDRSINTLRSFSQFAINSGRKNSTGRQYQHQLSQQPQTRWRLEVLVATSHYREIFVLVAKNLTLTSMYTYTCSSIYICVPTCIHMRHLYRYPFIHVCLHTHTYAHNYIFVKSRVLVQSKQNVKDLY